MWPFIEKFNTTDCKLIPLGQLIVIFQKDAQYIQIVFVLLNAAVKFFDNFNTKLKLFF